MNRDKTDKNIINLTTEMHPRSSDFFYFYTFNDLHAKNIQELAALSTIGFSGMLEIVASLESTLAIAL